jgi:hypothetical protein
MLRPPSLSSARSVATSSCTTSDTRTGLSELQDGPPLGSSVRPRPSRPLLRDSLGRSREPVCLWCVCLRGGAGGARPRGAPGPLPRPSAERAGAVKASPSGPRDSSRIAPAPRFGSTSRMISTPSRGVRPLDVRRQRREERSMSRGRRGVR